jgi:Bacterial surface proteins containing Ig-like domains
VKVIPQVMSKNNVFGEIKTKTKKMMSIILVTAILFSMSIPVMAASPGVFTDIPDNRSKTAIVAAISNGLLVGSGNKIMPNAHLKRCEMAAIINRAFGATRKDDISKFTDIPAGKWYVDDMAKAVKMGTFYGNGNKMRPEDPITRQEAFTVLARALKLSTNDYTSLDKFSDKAQVSNLAKPELAALVAAGYVNGSGGRLNPTANITRAEFAQVMYNVIKVYIKTAGTYTAVADGNVMINVPDVTLKGVTVKGDLIIGDGVDTGNVTLDAVKVEGRTIVRGGGKNSIHFINGSTIKGTVIIDNVNNEVRIVTDQGTTVQKIEAGSQVMLEGSFGDVKIVGGASGSASIEVKGNIQTLTVEAKADVTFTSGTVTKVDISQTASGTTINTVQGARIETVTANAQTNVTGNGVVTNVEAKANDVKVDTGGTKVTADQGVTGVTAGGNTVTGGSSTTTTPSTLVTSTTGGSGGSSPGGDSRGTSDTQNITLTASNFNLVKGSKASTTISVNPSDAALSFSSENTAIATVNQTTGEVTGVAVGATTITVNASKSGYNSASSTFTVTVVDVAISAVSDKMNSSGEPDPDGTYSFVDIDVSGGYYLTSADNKKEGFTITAETTAGTAPTLTVQSAEVHGGGPGQGQAWLRVTFTPSLNDFAGMHVYYNQLNSNPVKKSDGNDMPSFYLNVEKNDASGIITPSQVAVVTASPASGATIADGSAVSLSTTTSGTTIYYTTDGSTPTTSSTSGTSVIVTGAPGATITVKAYAVKSGMTDSTISTFTYTIQSEGLVVDNAEITDTDDYYSIGLTMSGSLTNTNIGDADAGDCAAFTVTGIALSHPQHVVVQTVSGISTVWLCFDDQVDVEVAINGGITVSYAPTGTKDLTDGTTPVAAFNNKIITKVIGNYTAASAGTYGPSSGTTTVNGNVTIGVAGVTLENLTITGDLIFDVGIGSGDAYINNVTVQGRTVVNGGGSNSIHIQGTSTLGVVEVDDQRNDQSNPINIEAEGTGSIAAVTVISATPVNITPDTDTIGFVAAVDGSTITYGDTANKDALLDKIVAKATYILDNALTGTDDYNYQVNDIDALVSGIIDITDPNYQMYKISCLKYYFNPLSGVAGRENDLDTLSNKLISVQNAVDVIDLRDNPTHFVSTMYNCWFPGQPGIPDTGFNQLMLNTMWDVFNRYITLEGYEVNGSGAVVASAGNTTPDITFITTAQTLYDNLEILQNLWTVVNVVAIDSDSSTTVNAGDVIKIKFKRMLKPGDSSKGKDAITSLITSDPRFGTGASVAWNDNATVDWFGLLVHVSECTITLGDSPDAGLLSGTFTVPKDKLGSYIPDGDVEYQGQYGAFISNDPPLFDIDINIPAQMFVSHIPVLDNDITRVNKRNSNSGADIERGDSIEIAFDCKLAQDSINSISNWVNGNDAFGTGMEPGGKCVFTIPDNNVTRLGIQFGSNPTILLGGSFTLPQNDVYDPTGHTAAGDLQVTLPDRFANVPIVQSVSVVRAVYDSLYGNELTTGDIVSIKFDMGLNFSQMDGISLAFAASGNVFSIPTGSYSNRTQVPDVTWSNDQTSVAITLQPDFTLRLSGSNTINYTGSSITVNKMVAAFTYGVSNVVVNQNGGTYDVFVTFFNAQDASSNNLRDALAAALVGVRDDPGSSGNTVKITGVAADKIGATVTIPSDKTSCGMAYGLKVPAAQ